MSETTGRAGLSNPVFDRLTHGGHRPSTRAAMWIGAGVGALVMNISLAGLIATVYDTRHSAINVLMAVALVLLGLVCALASFVWSAVLTARYALDRDFALLRISRLNGADIVDACVRAARLQLRLVWAVVLCVLPAGWVGLVYFLSRMDPIPSVIPIPLYHESLYLYFVHELAETSFVLMPLILLSYHMLWRLFVNLGVWVGLRWTRAATAIASGVALVAPIGSCLGMVWTISTLLNGVFELRSSWPVVTAVAAGTPLALLIADQLVYNGAVMVLDDHAPER